MIYYTAGLSLLRIGLLIYGVVSHTIYKQEYRSGHNEAVLKICSREFLQSAKKPCYA